MNKQGQHKIKKPRMCSFCCCYHTRVVKKNNCRFNHLSPKPEQIPSRLSWERIDPEPGFIVHV